MAGSRGRSTSRTVLFTALALVAFAANSVLCRLALSRGSIDPASFSSIRLISGAIVLAALVRARGGAPARPAPSWTSAALLFLYAVPFSFAYVSLGAGTGALLLFGAVQGSMLLAAFGRAERPRPVQWLGLACAFGGLVALVLPGVTAPPPGGAALMILAGIAWGLYSLRGRGVADPLGQTAGNFARAVPMVLGVNLVAARASHLDARGVLLASLSGAIASGLGYVVWYEALRGLSRVVASLVQLAVPVLAATAGIVLLGESVTPRFLGASLLVLGGIGLGILAPARNAPSPS